MAGEASVCQNAMIKAVKKVLVAPVGAAKSTAKNLGATNGGVTIAIETTINNIFVDQSPLPIGGSISQQTYTITVPLSEITLDNLALAFASDGSVVGGVLTFTPNVLSYYQMWLETDGPVDPVTNKRYVRTYYFERIAFSGSASIVMNRTDQQTITLTANVYACPDTAGELSVGTITDELPA